MCVLHICASNLGERGMFSDFPFKRIDSRRAGSKYIIKSDLSAIEEEKAKEWALIASKSSLCWGCTWTPKSKRDDGDKSAEEENYHYKNQVQLGLLLCICWKHESRDQTLSLLWSVRSAASNLFGKHNKITSITALMRIAYDLSPCFVLNKNNVSGIIFGLKKDFMALWSLIRHSWVEINEVQLLE